MLLVKASASWTTPLMARRAVDTDRASGLGCWLPSSKRLSSLKTGSYTKVPDLAKATLGLRLCKTTAVPSLHTYCVPGTLELVNMISHLLVTVAAEMGTILSPKAPRMFGLSVM